MFVFCLIQAKPEIISSRQIPNEITTFRREYPRRAKEVGYSCPTCKVNELQINEFQPVQVLKINVIWVSITKPRIVEKAEHYLYSSARGYCGQQGLIDIILVEPMLH